MWTSIRKHGANGRRACSGESGFRAKVAFAFTSSCCCDRGGGGAAAPVNYHRTVSRFPFKNVRHNVTRRNSALTQTQGHSAEAPRRETRCDTRGSRTCRGLKQRGKGSGYFSPAAVPSSGSGIRCGSIAYHGRRQKWRCLHIQRFFNNVRKTGDIRAPAAVGSSLDDTCHLEPQCPPPEASFTLCRATECAALRVVSRQQGELPPSCSRRFDSSARGLHQKPK
ncbi:unnamed protein product [Pleuronectes platessa]|uniref:Uncharacterized protein n=1 Tax=Pleuronectes platessa TaxID=8262 RepID=A0A9N7TNC6_PLEPL|nr:unnamed protein product [Pleuronectes platessa]